MKIYKIIFAKKTIVACHPITDTVEMRGKYYCEHRNGEPIYALVKAESETEAVDIGYNVIEEVREKVFGRDFLI